METRDIRIPRGGQVQTVVPQDEEELLRLRTELELLRRCGYGADEAFVTALAAKAQAAEVLRELHAILRDARDPVVTASLTQIDTEFPHLRGQIEHDVVRGEAAKIRQDLAEQVRTSQAENAAALAAAYEAAAHDWDPEATPAGPSETSPATSELNMSDPAIENVLHNVETHMQALQELVERGTGEAEAAAAPTEASVSAGADSAEADLEVALAELTSAADAAQSAASDAIDPPESQPDPELQAEGGETPTPVEAVEPSAEATETPADTGAVPLDEMEVVGKAAGTVDDMPTAFPEQERPNVGLAQPAATAPSAPEATSENTAAAPLASVRSIQVGLQQFAGFLLREVNELLTEAVLARDRLIQYQAEAAASREEIAHLHAQVIELKSEVAEEAELAHQARAEAQTSRDDAQRASKRAICKAEEAEIAADRALSESQAAQAHAQRTRAFASGTGSRV